MKLRTRLSLHWFCFTHLSLRAKSYKTDAKEVSYEALYEAPLTRKTRLEQKTDYVLVVQEALSKYSVVHLQSKVHPGRKSMIEIEYLFPWDREHSSFSREG